MATREIPFRPKLEGEFRTRFYNAVSQIKKDTSSTEIEEICAAEITWVESECVVNIIQRRKYRAAWCLFRDLVRASWRAEFKDGTLFMRLIELDEPDDAASAKKEAKDLIRSWMQESRREKIIASSDFIKRMESGTQDKRDISHLIADGAELAERLEKIKTGELDVTDAVQPYLQLVTDSGPNSIDPFTRQRIADIWRYFRMTWSTPAESTPGRTMQYLIRDAAHPMHAVMGLTELLLWDIWSFSMKNGSEDKPFIIVMDEAQNLDHGEKSPSAKILTEGRKFGLSGWYATQFMKPQLTDDEIQRLQQAGQKLYFCPPDDGVTTVAKSIDISTQGAKEWAERLKKLKKGECVTCGNIVRNSCWLRYNPRVIKVPAIADRSV